MDHEIYNRLALRIGEAHLSKRLTRQVKMAAKFYAKGGYASFHIENVELVYVILKYMLKALGLYQRGLENALDYRTETVQIPLENLPSQFDGFRILQLSDIHADAIHDKGQKLLELLKGISADLVVITGDFRFLTQGICDKALERTAQIIRTVNAPYGIFGILGNHDFIEFVPGLESSGIKMLLNEAIPVKRNGAEIWLVGVDDAHLYDCHDIPRAVSKVPEKGLNILLSHTPETYAQAEDAGVDYIICGHTHGGQICLPGGIPVITNARCPRGFCSGSWKYRKMLGYTSRATGSSGLPVRFFCPPEITVHELGVGEQVI
ncbi:MAG: metallophosphoesterase [Deltaproteobacteria bacterium]|nr:metallophosphoesterase [Deltaproteobacteria bacterium]